MERLASFSSAALVSARDVDDGEVARAVELVGDALPPDVAGRAVAVHDHVLGAAAGFQQALLVGLADLDPGVDRAGQVLLPQVRLVGRRTGPW
jgi:hypothetical protein